MKNVKVIVDLKPYEISCIDAPILTASGADIKAVASVPETYYLYILNAENQDYSRHITDGEAVILDADSPTEFFSIPQTVFNG